MSNEFNAYGQTTYLKASEQTSNSPLPNTNVKTKKNFSNLAAKGLGALPVVIQPDQMNQTLLQALGAISNVNSIKVVPGKNGSYSLETQIAADNGIYTGPDLNENKKRKSITGIIGWEPHSGGIGLTQWKYIDDSGSYVKGWLTRGKSSYFLDSDEYSVRGWKTIKAETESAQSEEIHYYFTVDGEMLMGWGGNGTSAVQYYGNIENAVKYQSSGFADGYVKLIGDKSIEKIKDLAKRYPAKFDNKNYISEQGSYEKVSGTFGLLGNIPDNGCGSIAMYNVMHFLGHNTTYEEILIDIIKDSVDLSINQDQTKDYPTVLDGIAGLNPAYIKAYLERKNYTVEYVPELYKAYTGSSTMKVYDSYLALYSWQDAVTKAMGAHYEALNPSAGGLQGYNIDFVYAGIDKYYNHKTSVEGLWVLMVYGINKK